MKRVFAARRCFALTSLAAAACTVAACSGPEASGSNRTLGYGTPSVSAFFGDGQLGSLQAELDRCRRVAQAEAAARPQGLSAACRQLQRTVRNQPGNTVQ